MSLVMFGTSLLIALVSVSKMHLESAHRQATQPFSNPIIPSSPDLSGTWSALSCPLMHNYSGDSPRKAPRPEESLLTGQWYGVSLLGRILATALNVFLLYLLASCSILSIAIMNVPVLLWCAAWWIHPPG